MLAQQYVSPENPNGMVPAAEWQAQEIANEIIEVRLASLAGEFVEISGGSKNFSWLVQKQVAAKKGGAAKAAAVRLPNATVPGAEGCPPTLPLTLSLNKKDLTEYTTHVVEEGGTGETAATEKPNHPRQRFKIHPALADDSINDVLATIADTTQKRWVGVYGDPDWTKKALKEAISFYTARCDDLSGGWGVVLHKALDRASRARINANGGRSSDLSHNDPKFWAKVFAQEAK